ncbi:MAG: redoxin domain-containing protein [Thermoleophilia bacterium]|nr:redoxin domain-containing protein [Thermoleophilia bacterium]
MAVIAALLLVVVVGVGVVVAATVGSAAPGFSGTTMDGQAVSLTSYAGKPLVLVFWASW